MASDAMIGYLTTYEIWDATATPAAFFMLGEVTEIDRGEESADQIDVTHFQSPDRRREKIAGLRDRSDGTITLNWVPGNETDVFLRAMADTGEKVQHRITYPNGRRVTVDGMVLSVSESVPIDDKMQLTVTIQLTGAETWDEVA